MAPPIFAECRARLNYNLKNSATAYRRCAVLLCAVMTVEPVEHLVKFFHFVGVEVHFLQRARKFVCACRVFNYVFYGFLFFAFTHTKSLCGDKKIIPGNMPSAIAIRTLL